MQSHFEFQSTHPRGVRLSFAHHINIGCPISIHAPTRGATVANCQVRLPFLISIHAPTRGATSSQLSMSGTRVDFNPRTHEGCDIEEEVTVDDAFGISIHAPTRGATMALRRISSAALVISIHAPTRGATLSVAMIEPIRPNFNPRTHEGCDKQNADSITSVVTFQSTHPRGVRLDICLLRGYLRDFNPRTHEGCDSADLRRPALFCIFQSTHPRGVRQVAQTYLHPSLRFQSTHPRGVRQCKHIEIQCGYIYFNPRTHEGCDVTVVLIGMKTYKISIHAPTRGATIRQQRYL